MTEEYELKIGVFSDERLQVTDLLQYLQAQLNDMVRVQAKRLAPGGKTSQKFIVSFEQMMHTDIDEQDYVGFLMIYNNAQFESIEFVKRIVGQLAIRSFGQTFLILVQMDAKNKINLANQQGSLLASKYKADFIKLSFENSGDLLQMINRYITQMLQSYYHPSSVIGEEEEEHREEEEEDEKQPQAPPAVIDYELNYISKEKEEEEAQDVPLFEDDNQEGLLERVTRERESRIKDITEQERDIDANIQNLQKVLENMDVHIKSKVQTDWYNNLKYSIYSRAEKQSESFSKIKLTQHFLKESSDPARPPQKIPVQTILIKKRPVLMRLQLAFNKMQIVVDVHTDSTYLELAKLALRKIGLILTDKNVSTMKSKIEEKIGAFVSELQRSIITIQEQKLARRKILK